MTKIIWQKLEPSEIVKIGDYFRKIKPMSANEELVSCSAGWAGSKVYNAIAGVEAVWDVVRPVSLITDYLPDIRSDGTERRLEPNL